MDVIKGAIEFVKEHWHVTIILLVVVFLSWHYVISFTSLKRLGIPGPTPLPIFGNSLIFIFNQTTLHRFFYEACKRYGDVFGLYILKQPSIVVSDPDMIKQILVKDFDKFHDRPDQGSELREPLASLLTSVKGQRWKDIRSIMTPAFTSGKLKGMMYIMHEAADTLLMKIEKAADKKEAVDIHNWQQCLSMEVILSAAYGIKAETQTNPDDKLTFYAKSAMAPKSWLKVVRMIPIIGKELSKPFAEMYFRSSWAPLIEIGGKILQQRRSDEKNKRKDLLQNMIDSQHPERKGHKLSNNEVIAGMMISILAGYDTSSNILGLTCYHLAIYPEIQEKVYQEIKSICQSQDSTNYDEIKGLHYLDACISETLRLYSPGFLVPRSVTKSCVINGVPFKKGMSVFIPTYAIHRDEKFWKDPDTFKPERFLPENRDSLTPFAYLPFGGGPRNCIGMRFAQMEMRTVLVRLLQRFLIVSGPETNIPVKVETRAVLAPAEPIFIRFEKRK